jgi:hypothetical protein
MKIKLILAVILLFSATAHADSIVHGSVGFTAFDDPLSYNGLGRVDIDYNQDMPNPNGAGFNVQNQQSTFTYNSAYNTLMFIPGTYDYLPYETLTIRSIGQRVDFLLDLFQSPYQGNPGFIRMFDWKLPQNVEPRLNNGIYGDRFYIDDVTMRIGTRPWEDAPPYVNVYDGDPVATPEPQTLHLLLIGLWLLVAWRLWT